MSRRSSYSTCLRRSKPSTTIHSPMANPVVIWQLQQRCTQIFGRCLPVDLNGHIQRVSACLDEIAMGG
jgi:hypothetical protein